MLQGGTQGCTSVPPNDSGSWAYANLVLRQGECKVLTLFMPAGGKRRPLLREHCQVCSALQLNLHQLDIVGTSTAGGLQSDPTYPTTLPLQGDRRLAALLQVPGGCPQLPCSPVWALGRRTCPSPTRSKEAVRDTGSRSDRPCLLDCFQRISCKLLLSFLFLLCSNPTSFQPSLCPV